MQMWPRACAHHEGDPSVGREGNLSVGEQSTDSAQVPLHVAPTPLSFSLGFPLWEYLKENGG